jgi:tetratricopeptide (TPR) repeat protein
VALTTGRRRALVATGLAALTLVVFWSMRQHAWLNYDDDIYITSNPYLSLGWSAEGVRWAFTTFHGANWFPLTWLSWMLDYELHGLDPSAFHTTSLLLHAGATALLFLALQRMTGNTGRSAFVAAVFALHPLHVESVAWASARKDTLSGLFFMLALLIYAPGGSGDRSPGRIALVFAALALGLLAKQTLVTLPFLLLLLDDWPLRRLRRADDPERWQPAAVRRAVLEKLPLFALVAGTSVVTVIAQRSAGAVADLTQLSLSARLANAPVACASYLGKTFWPSGLAVFYPHAAQSIPGWKVASALALLVGLTGLALRAARRHPAFCVGWFWFLGTLVPVIGLVQVGSQAMADRYMYLPLVGLALAVAWEGPELAARWIPDARRRRTVLAALACACITALAITTSRQLRHWQDSEALMRHALAVTQRNHIAHAHLGIALLERGEVAAAVTHWREASRLKPQFLEVHNNLAWLLATTPDRGQRDPAGAIELARRAARLAPDDAAVLDTLAAAYASARRFADAERTAERALGLATRAGDSALAADIERRLALYRRGVSYVER